MAYSSQTDEWGTDVITSRWIQFGKAAAMALSLIATLLGALALMIIVTTWASVVILPRDQLGTAIAVTSFLLICLCAAVTPFMAMRFFFRIPMNGVIDPSHRQKAGQVGNMMSVVAVPWWLFVLVVTWENIVTFDNMSHLLFQLLLSGTPAVLVTLCALAAFRIRSAVNLSLGK